MTSPAFRTLSAEDEKHLKEGGALLGRKLLMNIVVEVLKRYFNLVPEIQIEEDCSIILSAKQGQRGILHILNALMNEK